MRHTTKDVVLMTALSVAIVGMLAGCQRQAPADDTAAAPPPATTGAPDNAAPPAPAYQPPTAEQLYALVSPIALFPDKLVALTLAASTHPDDVHAARGFLEDNRNLSGSALIDAASNQPWDPSVKALVAFPAVVDQLDGHNDWTAALGAAYAAEPTDVLNAIQVMRQRARAHGSLADTPQQKIRVVDTPQPQATTTTTTVVEERRVVEPPAQTIEIEPAEPDVVYVPHYDPDVVYGEPVYSRVYTTERWYEPAPDRGDLVATGIVSFGVGVLVGELFAHHHDHPWGWNAWNTSWGGPRGGGYGPPAVVYDNHPYVVNRNTVINRYTNIDRSVHIDNRHNFGNVSVRNNTYNGAPPPGPAGGPAAAMAPRATDLAHMQRPNFNPAMMRATAPNARPALPPPGAERAGMMPRPAGEPGRPVDPRTFAASRPAPNAPHGVDPAMMQRNERLPAAGPGAPRAPEHPGGAEAFARDRQALAAHEPTPAAARPAQPMMDARHAPAPQPMAPRQDRVEPRMPPNDAARFAQHTPGAAPRMEPQRMDQRMPPREEPRMDARPEPRPEPRMEARPAPRPDARPQGHPESRPAPRHDEHREPEHKDDKHDH
ncbi:DUF3300 domain-containing protein [Luteibacter sp. PPL201]|uniref:DUF3300 domain-containing protein n=1 Tax=Luteibacter sahnii TaxID=3021977 RepID=A0ABT6BAD2_9GAMM